LSIAISRLPRDSKLATVNDDDDCDKQLIHISLRREVLRREEGDREV